MGVLESENLVTSMKLMSILSNGLNTGICWFIYYGSNSAAMSLRGYCLLKITKSLTPRCKRLMPVTLATSALGSAGVYFLTSPGDKSRNGWFMVASLMGGLLPYSLYFMLPINLKVMKEEISEEDAHKVIGKWRQYHFLRTVVSSGCLLSVAYMLTKN